MREQVENLRYAFDAFGLTREVLYASWTELLPVSSQSALPLLTLRIPPRMSGHATAGRYSRKGLDRMPSSAYFARLGGAAAISGVILLFIATFLHPMDAPPDDARAAFAEYAADQLWVASHLGQLLGVTLLCGGLLALTWQLRSGRAGVFAIFGAAGATVSLALSGALQAVDGVALKVMVDRWAAAGPDAEPMLFEAAFAVRQVETGLASMVNLSFGVTGLMYGIALLAGDAKRWLGWLGVIAGAATLISGIVQAYAGFSDMAMTIGMPSNLLLSVWALSVGFFLMRRGRERSPAT